MKIKIKIGAHTGSNFVFLDICVVPYIITNVLTSDRKDKTHYRQKRPVKCDTGIT